jgi:hypothetical protein
MFYIDRQLEEEINQVVEKEVRDRSNEMIGIETRDGLRSFVLNTPGAIEKLISLLNFSEERFKRIVTMLRLARGYFPTTEWSSSKIRSMMIEDSFWMEEILDLLSKGAEMEKYRQLIPPFYRENLLINQTVLKRLSSEDDIRRSVKKSFEGNYNNRIGDSFFANAELVVKKIAAMQGVTVESKIDVPIVNESIGLVIPNAKRPRILIDVTYGITTSSAQTKYAERAERISKRLRDLNVGKVDDERIIYINIVDGAGWVARQADLGKLIRASDYALNTRTLGKMSEILQYHFKKG